MLIRMLGRSFLMNLYEKKDNSGYIPNEVEALLNLMDTVFRDRENVRCVCLSNAVSVVNPYFLYFDLVPNINKRFNAYQNVLIEIPDSKDFSEERRKNKIWQFDRWYRIRGYEFRQ
jgi:hypothetical protein